MATNEPDQVQTDRVTGQQAVLKIRSESTEQAGPDKSDFIEVPITNVSWSRDTNTTEVQTNQGLEARTVITGLRYSGSFDVTGRNFALNDWLFNSNTSQFTLSNTTSSITEPDGTTKNQPIRATISVRERPKRFASNTEYKYIFKDCTVTSQSRDMPSDGTASTSYDFTADGLSVSTKDVNNRLTDTYDV